MIKWEYLYIEWDYSWASDRNHINLQIRIIPGEGKFNLAKWAKNKFPSARIDMLPSSGCPPETDRFNIREGIIIYQLSQHSRFVAIEIIEQLGSEGWEAFNVVNSTGVNSLDTGQIWLKRLSS